jgi:HAD superfamily hydrolase (TIGR01549 family)
MRKPLGVIFDFGGTVLSHGDIDVIGGNRRLYELAVNKNDVSFDDVRRSVERVTDWVEPLKNGLMVELTCESLNRLIYAPLGLTFDLTPAELEKEFWRASLKYSPVPGIYELLDLLELHDIKTGILSNSMYRAAMQEEELAGHNLAHRFSFIVTSADYGVRKLHPFIFNVAVKKTGMNPADIWFVGDTPGHDIKGALNAGLYPVWLNRRNEPRALNGDYLEVVGFDELRKVIEKLV